jgi:hypothetical protein
MSRWYRPVTSRPIKFRTALRGRPSHTNNGRRRPTPDLTQCDECLVQVQVQVCFTSVCGQVQSGHEMMMTMQTYTPCSGFVTCCRASRPAGWTARWSFGCRSLLDVSMNLCQLTGQQRRRQVQAVGRSGAVQSAAATSVSLTLERPAQSTRSNRSTMVAAETTARRFSQIVVKMASVCRTAAPTTITSGTPTLEGAVRACHASSATRTRESGSLYGHRVLHR